LGSFAAQYGRALERAGNNAEAIRWYQQAADQGNAAAQYSLGLMHEKGRGGLAKDDAEAIRWYKKAADQGNAAAQFKLTSLGRAE
jgi:uncharacterized protein